MAKQESSRESILNSVYADDQGNAGWMNGIGTKFEVTITIGKKQSKSFLLKDIDTEVDEFIASTTGYRRHNFRQFGDDIASLFGDGDLHGDIYILNKHEEPINIDGQPLVLGRWLAEKTTEESAA